MNVETLIERLPTDRLVSISSPCADVAILMLRESVNIVELGEEWG